MSQTLSQKLQQISQIHLEMVQGNDEVYRSVIKTRNFITRVLEPYDLTVATEMTMIIENKPEGIVYFTGLMTGGSPNVIVESAEDGLYRVEIPAATTALIPVGNWNYHVFVNTPLKKTAVIGRMRVIDD